MITDNPSFHFYVKNWDFILAANETHQSVSQLLVQGHSGCASLIHQWVMFRWIWGTSPRIYWLTVKKRCQSSKSTEGGQRYGKSTQMTPEVFFFLNLSKKVKFHLFCINPDTGYLLHVIVWILKAFSLPSHHSRVVFTISKK